MKKICVEYKLITPFIKYSGREIVFHKLIYENTGLIIWKSN